MRFLILVFLVITFSAYAADTTLKDYLTNEVENLPEFKGHDPVKTLYAKGFQVYVCNDKKLWELHEPLATLYSDYQRTKPVGLHYGACNKNECNKAGEVASADGICASGRKAATHKRTPAWTLDVEPYNEITAVDNNAHPKNGDKSIPELALLTDSKFKPGTGLGEIEGIERKDVVGGLKPKEPCTQGAVENVEYTATYKFFDVAPVLGPSPDNKPRPGKKYHKGTKDGATKT